MGELSEVISTVCPGVVRLAFYREHEQIGSGSGFLTRGKLVTNSHVIRAGEFDAIELTFGDQSRNPIEPIRLSQKDLFQRIYNEFPEGSLDYAVLDMSAEPEFANRHEFEIARADGIMEVGDQVLFFGFPFGSKVLTSHVGYISAEYREQGIHLLQIDGSINRGNSGGLLFHLNSGKVVGIGTRTQTGLERDFDELVTAIQANEQALSQRGGVAVSIGGVDPIQATRVTMTILRKVATNLKRSANVGIGWAFCAEHVLEGGGI